MKDSVDYRLKNMAIEMLQNLNYSTAPSITSNVVKDLNSSVNIEMLNNNKISNESQQALSWIKLKINELLEDRIAMINAKYEIDHEFIKELDSDLKEKMKIKRKLESEIYQSFF